MTVEEMKKKKTELAKLDDQDGSPSQLASQGQD